MVSHSLRPSGSQPPRVLVVDDEPQVLVALRDLLEDDFRVETTDQPERALRMVEEDPEIAVVLSDQRMPRMSGDELLAKLKEHSLATRVLCTGYADLQAVVRSVNEGRIFAYVTKPWDGDELRLKMQQAADHFRLNHELAYERQLLSDLMNSIPDGIFFKDAELKYLRVNPAFLERRGKLDAEVVGKTLSELRDHIEDNVLDIEALERRILVDGQARRDISRYRRRDGKQSWLSTIRAAVRTPEGEVAGLVGISQDIGESLRTQEALRLSEERLRLAFLASSTGLFDWNLETGETMYSPSAAALDSQGTGAASDFAAFEERIHPDDRPRLREALNAHLETRQPLRNLELRVRDESGEYRWFEISAQAAWNEVGRPVRLVGATLDITQRKEQHQRLAHLDYLTRYDELTGLLNRTSFTSELERELVNATQHATKIAVVAIDIVRFRHMNESLGRTSGDAVLREVGKRLTAAAPGSLLARFHSDSFTLMYTNIEHASDAAQWVESMMRSFAAEPFTIDGTEVPLSLKTGIAMFPSDASGAEALIANAEIAVKKAKQAAQPYLFYAPSMNAQVAEKLTLETRLRRALANEEFLLFYQPKVDLKSGLVQGVEALIRWRDPEHGLIPPGKFIPLLEETGLILQVGRWVIERAAKQYREWRALFTTAPRIAVNVSALQLAQRDFVTSLDATLAMYPETAEGLDLELTESILMDDFSGNVEKLRAAKDRGLTVSIDDFGTGYSSLGYLSRLPIDALKVDRSFITNMADDPQQMSIVTAIISLAHSLDLKVIAEGVETATQAQLLRLLRCDQIQGYLLARPEPAEKVVSLLGGPMEIPKPQRQ